MTDSINPDKGLTFFSENHVTTLLATMLREQPSKWTFNFGTVRYHTGLRLDLKKMSVDSPFVLHFGWRNRRKLRAALRDLKLQKTVSMLRDVNALHNI